jgi:hypothetical protein
MIKNKKIHLIHLKICLIILHLLKIFKFFYKREII